MHTGREAERDPSSFSSFPCWLRQWDRALLSASGLHFPAVICTCLGLKSSYMFPLWSPVSSESGFEEDTPCILQKGPRGLVCTQPAGVCPALGLWTSPVWSKARLLFMLLGYQPISMPHSPCTGLGGLAVEVARDWAGWPLHFRKEALGLTGKFWGAGLLKSILECY